jgi:hypothetical protein
VAKKQSQLVTCPMCFHVYQVKHQSGEMMTGILKANYSKKKDWEDRNLAIHLNQIQI